MTESEYEKLIRNSLQRFLDLNKKREAIDVELVKLRQFMYATLNMVPDTERERWETDIAAAVRKATANTTSLADSVRRVFESHPNIGYTISGIREALVESGFDFSSYVSNPLSSISTTLRRMADTGELETRDSEAGVLYFPRRLFDRSDLVSWTRRKKNK
jgi:hypothetical protein